MMKLEVASGTREWKFASKEDTTTHNSHIQFKEDPDFIISEENNEEKYCQSVLIFFYTFLI